MKVVLRSSAENAILSIAGYISETIKMPETADKYIDKLLHFAESIGKAPNAYIVCRYPKWKIKNLQCATFDKTWVFAFKVIRNKTVIYFIKNGKLIHY